MHLASQMWLCLTLMMSEIVEWNGDTCTVCIYLQVPRAHVIKWMHLFCAVQPAYIVDILLT